MSYSGYESGYRYRRYKKPAAVRAKKYIILGVILAVLIGLFAWFQRNVTDLLYSLSEATVRSLALSALNDAAAEALQWNGIDYDTLVTIERDAEGEITSIETDARQLNLLARQTVDQIECGVCAGSAGPGGGFDRYRVARRVRSACHFRDPACRHRAL